MKKVKNLLGLDLSPLAKEKIKVCKEKGGKELNLKDSSLKEIVPQITKLTELRRLDLSNNFLDDLTVELTRLQQLEELVVNSNNLKSLMPELGQLKKLRILEAENNSLTNVPSNYDFRLEKLNISGNHIEQIPNTLVSSMSQSIMELNWSSSSLTAISNETFSLSNLSTLNVSSNKISNIPENIGSLTNLTNLNLAQNELKSLPNEISSLKKLLQLNLTHNKFQTICQSLTLIQFLQELTLRENQLNSLDPSISNLTNLQVLDLSYNTIKEIPISISNLKELKVLNLSYNQISVIPKEVGYLGNSLRKLLLSKNSIQELPGEIMFLNRSLELDLSQNPLKNPFAAWYKENPIKLMDELRPFLKGYAPTSIIQGNFSQGTAKLGSELVIQAMDYKGQPRVSGKDVVTANIKGLNFDEDLIVKDNKNGTYSAFYNIAEPGTYSLSVTLNEEPIKGSPFDLMIN